MPSVKLFHGQKWILYAISRYSFMLHPKMFALCPSPSTIRAIVYAICLLSLILCANLCVTYGIWYVVCSVLYATCPDPLMMYPFCYVACLKAFMLCLKIHFVCLNSFITLAKISALRVIFCCVQFAMLYLQNNSFMLKIICGIGKITCGICSFTFCPLLLSYF